MFDINCILGDSVTYMNELLQKLDLRSDKILAYLDAHGLHALPLARELESLTKWAGEWIAIVDDFLFQRILAMVLTNTEVRLLVKHKYQQI